MCGGPGIIYMVIAKLLVICLATFLPPFILENQTTFNKGCKISDNVGLTQEFTRDFNYYSSSHWSMILVDFRKVFEMVRWDIVEHMLEKMGFDDIFISLIRACITSTSFSATVEGSPTMIFGAKRGLWWGDPFSPLLFIVVLEYFSKRLNEAMQNG